MCFLCTLKIKKSGTIFIISGCDTNTIDFQSIVDEWLPQTETTVPISTSNNDLPTEYDGGYTEIVLNHNKPTFTKADLDLSNGVW